MIIEKVRDSIENYEVFKEQALNIRFRKADIRCYVWSQNVLGILVYLFRFADSINEDNIMETIVQCRLMRMADNEEWKDDFWDYSVRKSYDTNQKNIWTKIFDKFKKIFKLT